VEASVEAKTARAIAKWLRISPRKVRLVADLVRGRTVTEALAILRFVPNRPAQIITRVVNSAVSNAENVHGMDRETLRIQRIMVDQAGPTQKRWQPVSRGMAHPMLRRLSHVLVEVTEDKGLSEAKAAREEARRRRRAPTGRGRGRVEEAGAAEPAEAPETPKRRPAKPKKAKPAVEAEKPRRRTRAAAKSKTEEKAPEKPKRRAPRAKPMTESTDAGAEQKAEPE
jgi:large subunit ribosomal protein L22